MISEDLLKILACPACHSKLTLSDDGWLVCQNEECSRKYPIIDDIPRMLISEGDKYREMDVADLPEVS